MDTQKLRQEKEILKFELNILKKQSSIVIDEIILREKLLEIFKIDAKNIQDKIQELAEKIDYSFLEATKISCHCTGDDIIEDCYANCDFTGFCPECKDKLVYQVNSNIKNCVNCGYSSKKT